MNEEIRNFWKRFLEVNPQYIYLESSELDAWSFGGNSNQLLNLVLEGTKTATSSLLSVYEDKTIPMPRAATFSIITDAKNVPRCVVYLEETLIVKFKDVGEKHAFEEGEGDRSLTYWRKIHRDFFSKYPGFNEDSDILCERFKVLWKE